MSSKDKTGAKLVASIRKSKTGTVASKTADRPDARETTVRKKASASRSASKATPDRGSQGDNSLYSRGRRVWPD